LFPDLIKIGSFTIHTYGILVAIGLLAGYFVALYFAKREGLDKDKIENVIFYSIIGGIIGARLFYVVEHHNEFNSFFDIFKIWEGGIDWFGAFIGGLITALFFIKKYNIPILKAGDNSRGIYYLRTCVWKNWLHLCWLLLWKTCSRKLPI